MDKLEKRVTVVETALRMAGLSTKETLTFDEAVVFTGFSHSYLYKLTSRREVPHYKPTGKCIFFNRSELEGWLQQNRIRTEAEMESEAIFYKPIKRNSNK